ncbi:MAG TPA: hypothetical protein VNQ32_14470 [Steroidobacteraceae bacterium]|nr:hypothetical protein [Steroidobacteraceae bacterium]
MEDVFGPLADKCFKIASGLNDAADQLPDDSQLVGMGQFEALLDKACEALTNVRQAIEKPGEALAWLVGESAENIVSRTDEDTSLRRLLEEHLEAVREMFNKSGAPEWIGNHLRDTFESSYESLRGPSGKLELEEMKQAMVTLQGTICGWKNEVEELPAGMIKNLLKAFSKGLVGAGTIALDISKGCGAVAGEAAAIGLTGGLITAWALYKAVKSIRWGVGIIGKAHDEIQSAKARITTWRLRRRTLPAGGRP